VGRDGVVNIGIRPRRSEARPNPSGTHLEVRSGPVRQAHHLGRDVEGVLAHRARRHLVGLRLPDRQRQRLRAVEARDERVTTGVIAIYGDAVDAAPAAAPAPGLVQAVVGVLRRDEDGVLPQVAPGPFEADWSKWMGCVCRCQNRVVPSSSNRSIASSNPHAPLSGRGRCSFSDK